MLEVTRKPASAGGWRLLLLTVALCGGWLAASATQAQICLDFNPFCDFLELTISGDFITGYWRNVDCEGTDVPVGGVILDGIPSPCPGEPGRAGVACLPEFGCFGNDEWYFVFDKMDGSVDLGHVELSLPPPGACWFDDIQYDIIPGPCAFNLKSRNRLPIASWQAREDR